MLCSKPLMDGPIASPAARPCAWARARPRSARCASPPPPSPPTPALFELALDPTARARRLRRLAHDRACCRRRAASTSLGLRWAARAAPQAQVRARAHGGRWTRWTPLPHSHGGDSTGTDPVFTGSRRRAPAAPARRRARPEGPLRARPPPRPRARARAARARRGAPAIVPRAELGRRQRPAARRPELRRRAGRVRAPHGHRGRLRARGIGRRSSSASRAITATPTAGTTSATTSSSTATA